MEELEHPWLEIVYGVETTPILYLRTDKSQVGQLTWKKQTNWKHSDHGVMQSLYVILAKSY